MVWRDLFSVVKEAVFGSEDVLANRRKQPRIQMNLPVTCSADSKEFGGELVDIGLTGMRLTVEQRLKRDQLLIVSVLPGDGVSGRPELRCSVVWCKQGQDGKIQAGVTYKDTPENLATSWVHYLLLQRNAPTGERKDRRVEAGVPVVVETMEGRVLLQGQVIDLSLGGAKIRVQGRLPQDEKVMLKIGGLNPSFKPIQLEAEVVGRAEAVPADQGLGEMLYGVKFFPNDSEGKKLKRLLFALLQDLRKDRRPKSSSVSGLRPTSQPVTPQRPQGPLADAVQTTEEPPQLRRTPQKLTASRFLRSHSNELLGRPASEPLLGFEPTKPKWRTAASLGLPPGEESAAEPPTTVWLSAAGAANESEVAQPRRRSLLEGLVAAQYPALEVARGWFQAAYLGDIPLYSWIPDQVARPTDEFFMAVMPMLPGCPALFGLHDLAVSTRNRCGPGLVWATRESYAAMQLSLRRPEQWVVSTARTRERLERRHLSLQERLYHLLAVQGLGGSQALRSMVACAQVASAIARETGLEDPLELNQLRIAALIKDIGESALLLGLAPKSQRERWSFFLHGVDTPPIELEELVTDWPGFRAKSDLLVARYNPAPEQLELLPLHSLVGEQILDRLGFPQWVMRAVRSHHEAFNGSGYPDGLAGREIPWSARCLAVADVFSGLLASDLSPSEALTRLEVSSGQLLDPELVHALRRYLTSLHLC